MLKNHSKQQKGFTIIEVLIVLAIAGLIMLIVFLAVPALQRNSRNTQRTADVAAIGGALAEYTNNNGGALPTDSTAFNTNVKPNYKLGFYDSSVATSVVYTKNAGATAPTAPGGVDQVFVQTYTKCLTPATATVVTTTTGASSRSVVALYRVETGSGSQPMCKEL